MKTARTVECLVLVTDSIFCVDTSAITVLRMNWSRFGAQAKTKEKQKRKRGEREKGKMKEKKNKWLHKGLESNMKNKENLNK